MTPLARIRLAGFAAAIAALLSAAAPFPARAIIGGTLDSNASALPFGGVASLSHAGGGTYSAVLIAPGYALTAAHAVYMSRPAAWTVNLNAGADLTSALAVEAIFVAPGYGGFVGDPTDGLVHNDLAILKLATPAPAGVPVYPIADLEPDAALTLVGYGASGDFGGGLAEPSKTAKFVGTNTADVFLASPGAGTAPLYDVFAFDVDATAGDATLARGDSGGAAFVNVGGQWQLAGINTFVFSAAIPNNTSQGGGMVVSTYRQWIGQVTAVPEPGAWAGFVAGLSGLVLAWKRRRARD